MEDKRKQKKSFWNRILEKLDVAMKDRADQSSCGCCCSSSKAEDDDQSRDRTCCQG